MFPCCESSSQASIASTSLTGKVRYSYLFLHHGIVTHANLRRSTHNAKRVRNRNFCFKQNRNPLILREIRFESKILSSLVVTNVPSCPKSLNAPAIAEGGKPEHILAAVRFNGRSHMRITATATIAAFFLEQTTRRPDSLSQSP